MYATQVPCQVEPATDRDHWAIDGGGLPNGHGYDDDTITYTWNQWRNHGDVRH